jgi:hypothetical protein
MSGDNILEYEELVPPPAVLAAGNTTTTWMYTLAVLLDDLHLESVWFRRGVNGVYLLILLIVLWGLWRACCPSGLSTKPKPLSDPKKSE